MPACSVCGDLLNPGARVCALCGTDLGTDPAPPSQAPTRFDEGLQWEGLEEPAATLAGNRCLVLYGPDRKPLHPFPLRKDITLIGRQDPLGNVFPDINVDEWLDADAARKVSRKHALVFHTRLNDRYILRPLAGNTGTQLDQDMVEALKDYPLVPGTRLVLGGGVRFKFEVES